MLRARVVVLGATGRTGRYAIDALLDAEHVVTAIVRDPAKLGENADRVTTVQADLMREDGVLARALEGQEAVVSAIGAGDSFTPNALIATVVPRLIATMKAAGVRRLVWTSAFGVGETIRGTPFVPRLFIRTLLRRVYADKLIGDDAIRASGLDWTIVQPTALGGGPATGKVRIGERLALRGFPMISRADVGATLAKLAGGDEYMGKTVLLTTG